MTRALRERDEHRPAAAVVGLTACLAGAALAAPTGSYWLLPLVVVGGAGAAREAWLALRG